MLGRGVPFEFPSKLLANIHLKKKNHVTDTNHVANRNARGKSFLPPIPGGHLGHFNSTMFDCFFKIMVENDNLCSTYVRLEAFGLDLVIMGLRTQIN